MLDRSRLKKFFSKGARPSEGDFESLIDSMVNKVEDGFAKSAENGLMLAPEGEGAERLISLYKGFAEQASPAWSIGLDPEPDVTGLTISQPGPDGEDHSRMFFKREGGIGVGTMKPQHDLDVNGTVGMRSRTGTYASKSSVPADGRWHTVMDGLTGCQGFEIMARAAKSKHGKYALLHAIALSTFGRGRIRRTQTHFGWWWNKIALRWSGSTYNYSLQIKTRSNYGPEKTIEFWVTNIWSSDVPEAQDTSETGVQAAAPSQPAKSN